MSLLRLAIVLGLIAYFVPLDQQQAENLNTASVSPFAAVGAAQATVSDLGSFCERNPNACATGRDIAAIMAAKAKNGVDMVADYFDAESANEETDPIQTAALPVVSLNNEAALVTAPQTNAFVAFTAKRPLADLPIPRPKPDRG